MIRFTSGGREFSLPIGCVERTERIPPTTPMPRAPDYVRGIASLRGGVVCVLDLAAMLGQSKHNDEWKSLLVVSVGTRRLGILSDTLPDFERVEAEELLGVPSTDLELYSGAVERDGNLVGLLDPRKLFDHLEERLIDRA